MKQMKFFSDEVQMHRDAYEKVSKYYPPNPILRNRSSFMTIHQDLEENSLTCNLIRLFIISIIANY